MEEKFKKLHSNNNKKQFTIFHFLNLILLDKKRHPFPPSTIAIITHPGHCEEPSSNKNHKQQWNLFLSFYAFILFPNYIYLSITSTHIIISNSHFTISFTSLLLSSSFSLQGLSTPLLSFLGHYKVPFHFE